MSEGLADWMLGAGVDTDMTGDVRPDAGKGIRFWMPKGSDRTIIFLTEGNAAPVLWEHQLRLGGKWTNWVSCLEPLKMKCGLCDWANSNAGEFRRSKVVVFTIIDTQKFKGKDGKERSNMKRLLVAKKDTAEILRKKYESRLEEGQGLKGAMFKVYRTNSDKSASVGTDFEFKKMVDLATLPDSEEYDYSELLAPNPDTMRQVVARLKAEKGITEGGEGSGEPEGTDEEVDY